MITIYGPTDGVFLVPVRVTYHYETSSLLNWQPPSKEDLERHFTTAGLEYSWLVEKIDAMIEECQDPNGSKSYRDIHKTLKEIQQRLGFIESK